MAKIDIEYHNLLDKILQEGYTYEDPNRKGIDRLEIPSYTFRHEFKDGFPAITTKKLNYKAVVTELIWFLRGDTNIKYLVDNGCNIWNKDAYNYYCKQCIVHNVEPLSFKRFISSLKNISNKKFHFLPNYTNYKLGDLGPVYGKQWRDRNGVDQFKDLIENLKNKPLEARHYLDAWNPEEKHLMSLPPCHYGFQIVVRPLNKIKCDCSESQAIYCGSKCQIPQYGFELHWNQMSCDTFLGLPFNISSYATLALILEKITGYKALAIQGDLKKVHLYDNSLDAVKEQLSRDYDKYYKCNIIISQNGNNSLNNYEKYGINRCFESLKPEMFSLENYESYPYIRVEMLERDE